MHVVVTGASGFLGRAVVARLRSDGTRVTAVSRRQIPEGLQVGDYAATPAGDVLIHLAQSSDRRSVNDAGIEEERASLGTLHGLLARGYGRIVLASSAVLYGDRDAHPHRVTDPLQVDDTYARIKRDSEMVVLSSGRGVVARLANLYGPGMSPANVVSAILRQVPGEGSLELADDTPVRDFIWYEDVAAGIVGLVGRKTSDVLNFGTGIGTSIGDLARQVLELAGQGYRPVVALRPGSRTSRLVLDISDTVTQCSWQPRVGLREGLTQLLKIRRQDA